MRVQKSYLVAVEKISGLEGNELLLENNKSVLVGESYRLKVIEFLSGFMKQKKK